MTARTYKLVMAVTKLIAVVVGGGALVAGAEPTTVILVVGAIVAGPDVVEAILANTDSE